MPLMPSVAPVTIHELIPCGYLGPKLWQVGRIILQISIHADDHLAGGLLDTSAQCSTLVPSTQSESMKVLIRQLESSGPSVGRAIVYEEHLIRLTEGAELGGQLGRQYG